ncbi:XRN 5'-3' exonuclease [Nitzschia inconspicua]|uniref:XRN 5'-3' exonuclease n=1 Tax=Nitzschia inconspicua TaxID=303405 RepID=A0A9K3LPW9_9STRA|nr:XRN 5'-3' exonuclease [Nitzschia inconspicua]
MWYFLVLASAYVLQGSNAFAPSFKTWSSPIQTATTDTRSSTSSTMLFGIPKMFRWLTDQYPDIINNRLEEGLAEDIEVDNFYLDMNGIIHPCTHGNADGELIFLDETAMFKKIFLYVDRLYKMVQPTQVLYLAVDGVAPRAKMNQQRSRRFRSAKEAEQLAAELSARENFMGHELSVNSDKQRFDSNCITPGTDFMLKLSLAMQKWVEYKQQTDPFWKTGATVIVSGPDVPGEGEHKVMDFIRESQEQYKKDGKATNMYGPRRTHVLYGLDADLIMLGLVTHEPNFMLLREKMSVVMAGRGRNKYRKKKDMMEYTRHDFELLELSSLRKLLAIQFRKFSDQLENYSLDRVVDDFVFMCMLVGNDFLSHCPHLEIDGGAISLMMTTYIDLLPEWRGYLTDREKINPDRFEHFMYHLAVYEEEHFKKRGYEENEPGWKLSAENEHDENDFYGTWYNGQPTPSCAVEANYKGSHPPPSRIATNEGIDEGNNPELDDVAPVEGSSGNRAFRRRHPGSLARSYRDFYYESKLGWKTEDRERTLFQRRAHVRDYMEGLHWNLNYYHNGCASWDWYFPHLYSPLATDMVNLNEFYHDDPEDAEFKSFKFEIGEPFPSLAQLLSVLPPQSSSLLPSALGELMLHPSSPLINYYPPDFSSDPNGKRQSWEAVVKIPFIDADLLLETVEQVLEKDDAEGALLSPSERRRNQRGKTHIYLPEGIDKLPNDGSTKEKRSTKKPSSKVKGSSARKDATSSARSTSPKVKGARKNAVPKTTANKR